MNSEPNQNQHPQSSLVLQTFSRLCSAGFIPSLDLDSDSQLLEWATHTKQLLDTIDNNNNHENSVSTTMREPKNPEMLLNDFVSLFSSHLEVRGYCEYDSLLPAENNNEDENTNDQEEENDENGEEQKQIKKRTKTSPTKSSSKPTNFTGPINSALPIRGGAQLLRHGNDIARVSRMAQRLAEEVASLQQAQIRMSTQHAQELDQQAVSFRGIISELLEQQARLEREIAVMSNSTNHHQGNISGSEVPVSPNRYNHPRPSPMPKLYIPH